jgi:hypothetical protein
MQVEVQVVLLTAALGVSGWAALNFIIKPIDGIRAVLHEAREQRALWANRYWNPGAWPADETAAAADALRRCAARVVALQPRRVLFWRIWTRIGLLPCDSNLQECYKALIMLSNTAGAPSSVIQNLSVIEGIREAEKAIDLVAGSRVQRKTRAPRADHVV